MSLLYAFLVSCWGCVLGWLVGVVGGGGFWWGLVVGGVLGGCVFFWWVLGWVVCGLVGICCGWCVGVWVLGCSDSMRGLEL